GKVEGGSRDLLEAQHVRVELAGLRHVGDGDAHVRELLEETHAVLLGAVRIAHFHGCRAIFGAQESHSFWGLSCKTKIAPSLTGAPSDSGVAKEMPPATSARSDSTLISTPLNRLRFTSTPLVLQKREPMRTSRAYRCSMSTWRWAAVE